jgi:hypothetical protein
MARMLEKRMPKRLLYGDLLILKSSKVDTRKASFKSFGINLDKILVHRVEELDRYRPTQSELIFLDTEQSSKSHVIDMGSITYH